MALSKHISLSTRNAVVETPPIRAIMLLILGAVAIGFAPIFVRLSDVGPFATGFWRMALAFPVLLSLNMKYLSKRRYIASSTDRTFIDYVAAIGAGVLFGIDLALWHLSLHYTTVANATMLCNCAPLLVVLWSWLVLKKPISKPLAVGLILAFAGVLLLINPHFGMSRNDITGDLLGTATAFFIATYIALVNYARKKFSATAIMAISTGGSAITLFLITWVSGESFLVSGLSSWGVLIGLALIVHVVGQGLIAYALPYLTMTFSSTALIIQPLVAAAISWFLFAEVLSPLQIVGIGIALAGIYLTSLSNS